MTETRHRSYAQSMHLSRSGSARKNQGSETGLDRSEKERNRLVLSSEQRMYEPSMVKPMLSGSAASCARDTRRLAW